MFPLLISDHPVVCCPAAIVALLPDRPLLVHCFQLILCAPMLMGMRFLYTYYPFIIAMLMVKHLLVFWKCLPAAHEVDGYRRGKLHRSIFPVCGWWNLLSLHWLLQWLPQSRSCGQHNIIPSFLTAATNSGLVNDVPSVLTKNDPALQPLLALYMTTAETGQREQLVWLT